MITSFTHIIVKSHVHPTVQHYVFASNRDKDAAAADILSSTLEREKLREGLKKNQTVNVP